MERSFRATKRFYLLLFISAIALVAFVVGSIYLMKKVTGNVRKLEQMTLYTEVESEAVVVRSERLFTESASESHILLEEGALVSEGDAIAVLYPYSYESQISAICTKEASLYTHLQSLLRTASGGTLPPAVIQYNEQISAASREMRAASNGETDPVKYAQLESYLIRLQKERRDLMVSSLDNPALVESEVAEIDALRSNFETNSARTIRSEYNGYISFYSDANEENLRDVSQLTVPLIKRILNAPSISMDNENFSYRIVTDRTTFYLAFVQSAKNADRLMPGLTYSFTVKGVKGAYQGRIVAERDTESGVLYVMQVNADVRPLLTTRVVEISVQNNATGLYVPTKYIQYTDGVPYIYAKTTDGTYQKVAVYIAGSDGDNAIVSARDSNISLFAGLKVRIPPEEKEND
ncbi:MAG: HlyD family efflux transporter periplasmic adaptor subunit [Clostridia bacterium]|nr:HlyD family efflux transporter periplasmic adaptor subunit [Clostridia bacterium]